MLMKPSQTVDVDRAVVHPDALQQVGGSGRSLANKHRLVKQIEYVAHISKVPFLSLAYAVSHTVGTNPLGLQSHPPGPRCPGRAHQPLTPGMASRSWRRARIRSERSKGPVA